MVLNLTRTYKKNGDKAPHLHTPVSAPELEAVLDNLLLAPESQFEEDGQQIVILARQR